MISEILFFIYCVSAVMALLILYISIPMSSKEKTIYFTCLILHLFLYIVGATLEISAKNINQALSATILQYAGFTFISPLFLLFTFQYTKKEIKNKIVIASLFVIPIFSFIMVFTYRFNNIFYKEFELVTSGVVSYIKVKGSIYYNILFIYINSIYFINLIVVIRAFLKGNEIKRKKIKFLLILAPMPILFGLSYYFGLTPYGMDIAPVFMLIVCICVGYNILVKNLFLSIPYARDSVLSEMRDGYVLFDSNNNYLDANKVAIDIFPELKNAKVGKNIFNYINVPKIKSFSDELDEFFEFSIINNENIKKDYRITVSNFTGKKNLKIFCWIFLDITDSKNMMNELEYIAKFDVLTGVYNRLAFFEQANIFFNSHKNTNEKCAVILLDIDFFKSINDKYGHICGDYAIVEISSRLKHALRKSGIIARYGGEEFVIFIESVTYENIYKIGENLRKSIADKKFVFQNIEFDMTISMGIAIKDNQKHKSLEDMLSNADELLYKAKNAGRNLVKIK